MSARKLVNKVVDLEGSVTRRAEQCHLMAGAYYAKSGGLGVVAAAIRHGGGYYADVRTTSHKSLRHGLEFKGS